MVMNKIYFMLAILLASVNSSLAQKWAVKSNLLYDATATINLGVEAALGPRVTLDISGNYNPWEFGDARWKHWLIQPEVRYWLCERFNGHFFGLHAHYAEYNAGGINSTPISTATAIRGTSTVRVYPTVISG